MDENEIVRALGRLEGKVDSLLNMHEQDDKRFARIETDVDDVKKKVWYGSGIAFAASLVAAHLGFPLR